MTSTTENKIDSTATADNEALLAEILSTMSDARIELRPLSQALELEAPDNEDLSKRLRETKIANTALMEDKEKAKKANDRFANLDRFDHPMGPVTIGHIAPAKEAVQQPDQKEFVTGSRVELLLENNVTIVETRTVSGVKLQVHARTLRITDDNLTKLEGLSFQDVIALPPLVSKHFGEMTIGNVGDADGHILFEIAAGEGREGVTAELSSTSATPLIQAIFDRLTPYEQTLFAASLNDGSIYDGRIGAGIVRKTGVPGAIEITHIDPDTLTQLKEINGSEYSILLAQAIPSHLVAQLEGMPVREVSEMEDWMLSIYGDKTIKQILNAGGNCTLTLA